MRKEGEIGWVLREEVEKRGTSQHREEVVDVDQSSTRRKVPTLASPYHVTVPHASPMPLLLSLRRPTPLRPI